MSEKLYTFDAIAKSSEIPEGERLFIEISGRSIVVFNIGGQLYAIEDICTHDNGPLGDGEVEGFEVICPRHGARFDVRDGRVTRLPAVQPVPHYPVRIVGDTVEVGIPTA